MGFVIFLSWGSLIGPFYYLRQYVTNPSPQEDVNENKPTFLQSTCYYWILTICSDLSRATDQRRVQRCWGRLPLMQEGKGGRGDGDGVRGPFGTRPWSRSRTAEGPRFAPARQTLRLPSLVGDSGTPRSRWPIRVAPGSHPPSPVP